jgi:septal ring factor EnvC (AmiA/AmiB activator)
MMHAVQLMICKLCYFALQVEYLKRTIDSTKSRAAERRESEEKAHAEEVDRLQRANETLKTGLEALLGAPKK